jgi:hypothetical protein
MSKTWNVSSLTEYFASQRAFPQKYNTLMATDPAGRLVNAITLTGERIRAINEEYAACHSAGVSIFPDITDALQAEVSVLVERRTRMYQGLEACATALNGCQSAEEPTVDFLQAHAEALRRTHKDPNELAVIGALIARLGEISPSCFQ